jgi:hypothetical protein
MPPFLFVLAGAGSATAVRFINSTLPTVLPAFEPVQKSTGGVDCNSVRGRIVSQLWRLIWREAGMMQRGTARVVTANRDQTSFDTVDLDAWLPANHLARTVVAFVARLDLRSLYAAIEAREGGTGRPALDPAVLLALWLYATLDGVGSARG